MVGMVTHECGRTDSRATLATRRQHPADGPRNSGHGGQHIGRFVTGSALILALAACGDDTSSTPVTSQVSFPTWVGQTLEGDTVVVADDGNTGFVDGVPSPVDVIRGVQDCASVLNAIDFWTDRMADPSASERASAYVVVAEARLRELGCTSADTG